MKLVGRSVVLADLVGLPKPPLACSLIALGLPSCLDPHFVQKSCMDKSNLGIRLASASGDFGGIDGPTETCLRLTLSASRSSSKHVRSMVRRQVDVVGP